MRRSLDWFAINAQVYLLNEMAEAELFVGRSDLAAQHQQLAQAIAAAMNQRLWQQDHMVTQLNPDGALFCCALCRCAQPTRWLMTRCASAGSTRDFVDYDANLLAVHAGVVTGDRMASLLKRVDGGNCTHGRATFVSERFYGPSDCYLNNTGDSAVSGRFGRACAACWQR